VGEDVPDALAASVFVDRAFDLIARGRCAPYEGGGKRTIVVGGMTRAYNSARGEQAERRRQQSSARRDQHRGRAAPAGSHGREGGGRGMKSASGGRAMVEEAGSRPGGAFFAWNVPDVMRQRPLLLPHSKGRAEGANS